MPGSAPQPANTDRVFTDEELAQAGEPTVDSIERCLQSGDTDKAIELVKRFQYEIRTMFYSYRGWEKAVLDVFSQRDGEQCRNAMLQQIEEPDIAPERMLETESLMDLWDEQVRYIISNIKDGLSAKATYASKELRDNALEAHDGMMSRVTALLTLLYEKYGDQPLMQVLQEVMRPELMDPDGKLPVREKVEKIIHFNRAHFQPFTLVEDDEKITFLPNPCGSGQRLIQAGHFDAPRNGARVKGPSPLTYGRDDLPVYCCHEPAMELASILRNGVPVLIVDPPADVGISQCKVYVYKNPQDIPEHYYQRLGQAKPADLIASSD